MLPTLRLSDDLGLLLPGTWWSGCLAEGCCWVVGEGTEAAAAAGGGGGADMTTTVEAGWLLWPIKLPVASKTCCAGGCWRCLLRLLFLDFLLGLAEGSTGRNGAAWALRVAHVAAVAVALLLAAAVGWFAWVVGCVGPLSCRMVAVACSAGRVVTWSIG
jgi:hypothetical protein